MASTYRIVSRVAPRAIPTSAVSLSPATASCRKFHVKRAAAFRPFRVIRRVGMQPSLSRSVLFELQATPAGSAAAYRGAYSAIDSSNEAHFSGSEYISQAGGAPSVSRETSQDRAPPGLAA